MIWKVSGPIVFGWNEFEDDAYLMEKRYARDFAAENGDNNTNSIWHAMLNRTYHINLHENFQFIPLTSIEA